MRTEQDQAAVDALEVRLLRLLQIERLAYRHMASTTHVDLAAIECQVRTCLRDWRQAVGTTYGGTAADE